MEMYHLYSEEILIWNFDSDMQKMLFRQKPGESVIERSKFL